jgi:hypothetical protein
VTDLDPSETVDATVPASRSLGRRLVPLLLVASIIGVAGFWWTQRDPYGSTACKGVGISQRSLGSDDPLPPGSPTAEQAVVKFAKGGGHHFGGVNDGLPFPIDGWKQHNDRWVHDATPGFYDVSVKQVGSDWYVSGISHCSG